MSSIFLTFLPSALFTFLHLYQLLSCFKFSNHDIETIETDNEESLGFDEDHLVETDANNEYERDNEKVIEIVRTLETDNEESLGFV